MATYFTDFSEYSTGSPPSDWTARYEASPVWSVEAATGATGGNVLAYSGTSNELNLLSWDEIDSDVGRDDVEIVARVRLTQATSAQVNLVCRASGTAPFSDSNQYEAGLVDGDDEYRIGKLSPGFSSIASVAETVVLDTWYWIRFRVIGTSLKMKLWLDTESEPGTWGIDTTDSDVTGVGWVGIGAFWDEDMEVDLFGVGTDGDTAPTSGSQTVVVGQAAETSAATAMVLATTIVTGQAAETDAATTVGRAKVHTSGQAAETSAATAIVGAKTFTVGLAAETSAATATTSTKQGVIGQAAETDAATPLTAAKTLTTVQATETSVASAITVSRTELALQAAEEDNATAVTIARAWAVGQASETSTATGVAASGALNIGLSAETDAAQPVGHFRVAGIGLSTGTDVAQSVASSRAALVGQAGETNAASSLGHSRLAVVGVALESDTAGSVTETGGAEPEPGEGDFWIIRRRRRWV